MTRKPDDDAPFAALAFKILNDPFVGNSDVLSGVFQVR